MQCLRSWFKLDTVSVLYLATVHQQDHWVQLKLMAMKGQQKGPTAPPKAPLRLPGGKGPVSPPAKASGKCGSVKSSEMSYAAAKARWRRSTPEFADSRYGEKAGSGQTKKSPMPDYIHRQIADDPGKETEWFAWYQEHNCSWDETTYEEDVSHTAKESTKDTRQWVTLKRAEIHYNDADYANALCMDAYNDTEEARWKDCSRCPHLPAGRKYLIEWEFLSADENSDTTRHSIKRKADLAHVPEETVDKMVYRMGPPPKKQPFSESSLPGTPQSVGGLFEGASYAGSDFGQRVGFGVEEEPQEAEPWTEEPKEEKRLREEQEAQEAAQEKADEEEAAKLATEAEADKKARETMQKKAEREEKQKELEKDPSYCITKFLNDVGKTIRSAKTLGPQAKAASKLPSGMGNQYEVIFQDHDTTLTEWRSKMEVLLPDAENVWDTIKPAVQAFKKATEDLKGFNTLYKTYYPEEEEGKKAKALAKSKAKGKAKVKAEKDSIL